MRNFYFECGVNAWLPTLLSTEVCELPNKIEVFLICVRALSPQLSMQTISKTLNNSEHRAHPPIVQHKKTMSRIGYLANEIILAQIT